MREIEIVVATDERSGIGRAGGVPWRLPTDLAFLKRITTETRSPEHRNAVFMGRVTWETVPKKWQPLPKRINAVVSRRAGYAVPDEVILASSITEALDRIEGCPDLERIFCLGGGEIYRHVIAMPSCTRLYVTRIEGDFDCDAFFPDVPADYERVAESERHEENGVGFVFQTYERR